jgi:pimeloyl-ACP methyl ester carboxylesterase
MSQFEERFFETDDGLKLYCRDYAAPTPSAATVVCLHGLSRNSRDFQDLAPVLNQHFRVLVPEQRGRGRSDYDPVPSRYNLMQYVHDTYAMLVAFHCERVSVVGTSMGGLMTFALNALYPHLIHRAVINDIGPDIAAAGLERIQSYVGVAGPFDDWDQATSYVRSISQSIFPDWQPAQWAAFARQCYVEQSNQIIADYDPKIGEALSQQDTGAESSALWSLFETLRDVPLLLIRGALTDLLSVACVQAMQQRAARFELLTVPNVGHAPMLTEAEVPEAIMAFLTQ